MTTTGNGQYDENLEEIRKMVLEKTLEENDYGKVYVLGFLLSKKSQVTLIEKNRGPCIGKLNGLGGTVEIGETIPQAMTREFKEESSVYIEESRWNFLGCFMSHRWLVNVFFADAKNREEYDSIKTTEDEVVGWYPISSLNEHKNLDPTARWLISACLDPTVYTMMVNMK